LVPDDSSARLNPRLLSPTLEDNASHDYYNTPSSDGSRLAIAVVRGLRELRSSGRSQTQRVRTGSAFMRPGGGVRSATSGRRAQRQLARAVCARSLRTESIERTDWNNDGTNPGMSQDSGGNPRLAHLAPRGHCSRKPDLTEFQTCRTMPAFEVGMLVAGRRTEGLDERGNRHARASVRAVPWLPLRLPISCQKGLKPPLLATRIRRKYPVLSAGYELLSKLQNLYAPVRSRPAPPNPFLSKINNFIRLSLF
jgi:hypothetical protein